MELFSAGILTQVLVFPDHLTINTEILIAQFAARFLIFDHITVRQILGPAGLACLRRSPLRPKGACQGVVTTFVTYLKFLVSFLTQLGVE